MREFTSRERIQAVLNHQEPDRIPISIGGTGGKITESRMELLKNHFGISGDVDEVLVGPQMMRLDNRVLDALGTDIRYVNMRPPTGFREKTAPDGGWYYDWGLIYKEHPISKMYDYVNQPLAGATIADLDNFDWPDPFDPVRWAGLREETKELFDNTGHALVAYRPTYNGLFELCQVIRGTEQMLMDLVLDPGFAEALFWKVGEVFKDFYQAQLDAVGDFIEWVELGDDLGGQNGPLISPAMYRSLLKPVHADIIRSIKSHPSNPRVMFHSCGSIKVFIPDFIEMGVDILNPIQVAAKGIIPAEIKKEFGADLCFLGGVDSQHLMPTGTPEQVADQVKQRILEMGPGGGYVLAPSHNIGDDIPLENILSFFKSADTHGKYPLSAGL